MNENEQIDLQEEAGDKATAWVQDNLRVIVSVFIVAAIALGIYSYSGRNANTDMVGSGSATEETTDTENALSEIAKKNVAVTEQKTPVELSRETETSFIESAEKGNGSTHLARRALSNYLEKNPDSSLSREHKVYIEDYLRKNADHKGSVKIGTSIEFSKTLIDSAISKSKMLNDRQLENLKKYSARAPSLK